MSEGSTRSDRCLLCGSIGLVHIYAPREAWSVTSDCQPWPFVVPVVVCRRCAHLQKRTDEALARQIEQVYAGYDLYHLSEGAEQLVFQDDGVPPAARSALLLERLDAAHELPAQGSLLDVGCGNGATLRAFGRRHPTWPMFGLEPNDRVRETVLAIPGVAGFYAGPAESLSGSFELITLIHVLEHSPRPGGLLTALRKLLRPSGLLLIQVPNVLENPFDMLVLDHYSHFGSETLGHFVAGLGFDVMTLATNWVPKEITLVLRRGTNGSSQRVEEESDDWYRALPANDLVGRFHVGGAWLERIIQAAEQQPAGARLGVFGTAIAGTWLGATLGEKVAFFVDEDLSRVGRHHLGKPVLHPRALTKEDRVFLALPHPIASRVRMRLAKSSVATYIVPPPV